MDSVKILVNGYARKLPGGRWDATSTTVLVRSDGKKVLIDPGQNAMELQAALARENLKPEDIDIIVNSHSHIDHTRNSRLFDKNKIYNPFNQYKKPPEGLVVPSTNIRVVFTPGHVDKHIAFLAETAEGKCAAAGDAFWWEDGEEQKTDDKSLIEHLDPVGKDREQLQESRKKLLALAEYIIPGHGKPFRVPR